MSKPTYQLTKEDIREANVRFLLVAISTFNYQTQLGPSVVYSLYPALRKLYPNDE
ncbi:MAG: PTS system mannose/fructose/sorbose family transporter subunit IID, partial [Erysipelotrichaceae bacterium]|nr:PTS system mannose/fructose/sorbose family transporter subunit IID [Erysipelotrichaceae bacterium]